MLRLVQDQFLKENKLHLIMTPNPEQIIQSRGQDQLSQRFLAALQSADLLLPDGVGLVLASRFLGRPIQEKVSGVWLVSELLKIAANQDLTTLVIGGKDYDKDHDKHHDADHDCEHLFSDFKGKTSKNKTLKNKTSKNKIKWTPAYRDVTQPTREEQLALQTKLRQLKPDLVFVAFGAPQQELWLAENRQLLEENGVKIAMAVGGSFDFLFGKVKRAPRLVRQLGLEWLFRLIQEPWRWKRQTRLIKFIFLTLQERKERSIKKWA